MRTFRSVVAIVSTALLMACQTGASAGGITQAPAPLSSAHANQSASTASTTISQSATKTSTAAVESTGSKKTWIIIGLLAAIAIVAVVLVSGGSDDGGIY